MNQLVHPTFDSPIEFENGIAQVLIVESQKLLIEIFEELITHEPGETGGFTYSDGLKVMNMEKHSSLVMNPFVLDFWSKKIQTGILSNLRNQILESGRELDLLEIKGHLDTFFADILIDADLPLCCADYSIQDILKLVGVSIDVGGLGFLQRVLLFFQVQHDFAGTTLFVMGNFLQYLTEEEFNEFSKFCGYQQYDILLIENRLPQYVTDTMRVKIIDSDLCEI